MGFVEVAVTGDDDLTPLLEDLGFRHEGDHRTKPVSWWRNGEAHALLNSSSALQDRWSSAVDRPSVTSVGLEVRECRASPRVEPPCCGRDCRCVGDRERRP